MNISILYFSGTGNTEIIANLIAHGFQKDHSVDIFKIEDILLKRTGYDINNYDMIGIGYPIYGFNPPFNIFNLVNKFENSNHLKLFLFSTCAGPIYLNDIASYGLKRKLVKKGFSIIYEKQFYMPPNVAVRYKAEVIKQLYFAATRKITGMVNDINAGVINVRNDGVTPLLFRWSYLTIEKISWATVPLDFKISSDCDLCMKCVRQCPQNNIRLFNNKIKYGLNCLACYRCVYNCPKKAITGRLYKFAILKEFYDIKSIINDSSINGNDITNETKGYYRIFNKYLNE